MNDIKMKSNRNGEILIRTDKKYKFMSKFNTKTGHYVRTDIENEPGKDPFMTAFPELIDIGIMGHCTHGLSGKCKESGIQCYQHGDISNKPNMTLDDYKSIIDECSMKTFQVALGGCGDPDMHEDFEGILKYTREKHIVPNFTTSGFGMTAEKADICKKYCGAVAVSMYSRLADSVPELAVRRIHNEKNKKTYKNINDIPVRFTLGNIDGDCIWDAPYYKINGLAYSWDELHHMYYSDKPQDYEFYRIYNEKQDPNYTMQAIKMLLDAGVTTNIHYVLSSTTIDEAIIRLKYNGFPKGINAVIFLLHKPVGLGQKENMISLDDRRVNEFFKLIDAGKFPYQIGFDSCTVPAILNTTHTINKNSLDTCEAARWSMYITPDMKVLPCSFDNQDMKYVVDLKKIGSIQKAWDSVQFEQIRNIFKNTCRGCSKQSECLGGCPLMSEIVLCKDKGNKCKSGG